jgi:hypothetical protein
VWRAAIDELDAMAEPDVRRANELREIFAMFGEILADIERAPITIEQVH